MDQHLKYLLQTYVGKITYAIDTRVLSFCVRNFANITEFLYNIKLLEQQIEASKVIMTEDK